VQGVLCGRALHEPTQPLCRRAKPGFGVDKNNFAPTWVSPGTVQGRQTSISANYRTAYDRVGLSSTCSSTSTTRVLPQRQGFTRTPASQIQTYTNPWERTADLHTTLSFRPYTQPARRHRQHYRSVAVYAYTGSCRCESRGKSGQDDASVAYVGNKATGLYRAFTINQQEIVRTVSWATSGRATKPGANGIPTSRERRRAREDIPATTPGQVPAYPLAQHNISQGRPPAWRIRSTADSRRPAARPVTAERRAAQTFFAESAVNEA